MYLARKTEQGVTNFIIRESFRDEETGMLTSRDLCDVGQNPGQYFVYPGGNAFYLDPDFCDLVEEQAAEYDAEALEELFLPFLDREILITLGDFARGKRTQKKQPMTKDEIKAVRTLHLFDKMRLLYLRTGNSDLRGLYRIKPVFFRDLLEKSRDELEQFFLSIETMLDDNELKMYAYVVFDIQRFFSGPFARTIPQALDQEKVDKYFEKEFCKLADEKRFWAGYERDDQTPAYLARYLIMYFDNTYREDLAGRMDKEYVRSFMNSRRRHRPPPPPSTVSPKETADLFEMSGDDLKKMSQRELTQRYRKMAHEHHPDKGGDKDKFVKLTEAYRRLLHQKKRK